MAATVIVLTLVFGGVILAVRKLLRDRKKGTTCGCGCSSCAYSDKCGEDGEKAKQL